jgi:hypothetical protein
LNRTYSQSHGKALGGMRRFHARAHDRVCRRRDRRGGASDLRSFVAAQSAHDIAAVESLLVGSPEFLWITRGAPVWGADAALNRFASLYEGTWQLEPEPSGLKVMMIGEGAAQVFIPINFTIGAPGEEPNAVPDEHGAGESTERLEELEHPADTCARSIVNGGAAVTGSPWASPTKRCRTSRHCAVQRRC